MVSDRGRCGAVGGTQVTRHPSDVTHGRYDIGFSRFQRGSRCFLPYYVLIYILTMRKSSPAPIPSHLAVLATLSVMAMSTGRVLSASAPCHIVESYYPKRLCRESDDPIECRLAPNSFGTKSQCCDHFGSDGCTPDDDEVQCFVAGSRYPTTSWIASTYYPVRECYEITDGSVCQRGWGSWLTYQDCCAPNAAHADGCGSS